MAESPPDITHTKTADAVVVSLSGVWRLGIGPQRLALVQEAVARSGGLPLRFEAEALGDWDSSLLSCVVGLVKAARGRGAPVDLAGLPAGLRRLVALALAVPEREGARRAQGSEGLVEAVGRFALTLPEASRDVLGFLGEAFMAASALVRGKAAFRRRDFFLLLQETGIEALPIVSLISLLVGLILAFVGAVQLKLFGAQIYVASLVAIAMVRVMGAIMTGIIMSGRTGASFAAELGTMQVNEELDALTTLGVSPMEHLVLPRMLALVIMMPLLTLWADLMGMAGGLIVGVAMLDLGLLEYVQATREAFSLTDMWIGLVHSTIFGMLIAICGCYQGMSCGRSASAVGKATTSAVVTGIVSIIVATAIITVVCDLMGI